VSRRWTPRTIAVRAIEVSQAEGLPGLALRVLGELGYRRMILMERPFDLTMADVDSRADVVFRQADAADADELGGLIRHAGPDVVRRRLAAGHICWIGLLDGRIVQCCWIGIGRARIDYLDAELVLPPGVGYLYDLYTAPELRGLGLHRTMYPHIFRSFASWNPLAVCAAFHLENRMHRIFERLGFRTVATIGYIGIAGWRKLFYKPVTDGAATREEPRSRSRRGETPSFPGASTPRSPGRASSRALRGS
jgi:GNAT superfamily N-acetyltransferase